MTTRMPALKLESFLPYRMARLAEAMSQEMRAIYQSQHGLTRSDWRVLAWLAERDEMTASEIGMLSDLHKTKVSRSVRRLEERRWLSRETATDDRRFETLRLTDAGRDAFIEISRPLLAREAELLGRLSESERKRLAAALTALEKALAIAKETHG